MFSEKLLMLIKNITNIFSIFESFQEGDIVLPYGENETVIKTRKTPVEVWLKIMDDGNMPICQGSINMVGYKIIPDGFVLYTKIANDSLQVAYFVEF